MNIGRYKLGAILLLSLSLVAFAEPKTVSVLTIGNSFAENALRHLPQLAEAGGHTLIVGRANLGGCTLERHWKHVEQFEKNPEGKEGAPYGKGKKQSLDAMLKKRDWDFITIQQVSFRSHDLTTYYPFAPKLIEYIRERAPKSKILVHQIWAYRVDDPRFVPKNEGKEPHTHQEMYEQVRKAYHSIAKEFELGIIPSGDAMFLADTSKSMGYRPDATFDFKNAKPPALPDQTHSLHVGWAWRKDDKGVSKLKIDGHHANSTGEYLLGCVWFETLFGESVLNNTYSPKRIESDYATFLREKAHEAVSNLDH